MNEKSEKVFSVDKFKTELHTALSKCQLQDGAGVETILNTMVEVIANAYCELDSSHDRLDIDASVNEAIKNQVFIVDLTYRTGDNKSLLENTKFQLELYKRVACLLADKLNAKSNPKKDLINETRQQLS
jgi:hypothetical protein